MKGVNLGRSLLLLGALLLGAAVAQDPPPTPPAVETPASPDGAPTTGDSSLPSPDASPATSGDATSTAGTSVTGASDVGSAFTAPSEQAAPVDPDAGGGSVELTRKGKDGKERRLTVVKTSSDDATGIFAICAPQDDEPDSTPTEFVASDTGRGGVQVTVDKNLIQAPLALITKQPGGDGHIEMMTGDARYLPDDQIDANAKERLARCGVQTASKVQPDTVLVTQGKTHLKGAKVVYDEKDGVARVDGPVTFNRAQDGGDPVNGSAERIEVSVDDEKTTLVGKVSLKQGNRTSTADRVDYDDTANTAILYGSDGAPAQTQTPTEVLRAQTIRYFLNTGEAVVEDDKGGISGRFDDGTPGTSATPGTSGAGPAADQVTDAPAPGPTAPTPVTPAVGTSSTPAADPVAPAPGYDPIQPPSVPDDQSDD